MTDSAADETSSTVDATDLIPDAATASETADGPALTVTDLKKTFGGLVAVDGASFEVPDGSITGVMGPNGAGKTTLFNVVSGVYRPDGGSVHLYDRDVTGLAPPKIARAGLGRTFQVPRVFAGMSVDENLRFSAFDQVGETITGALFRPRTVAQQESSIDDRADEILAFLELEHLAGQFARELSGGQRKLLELGRILMTSPSVLLLDEPFAGVNPALTEKLVERLHELNDLGMTIIVIEHNVELLMEHSDHVVVLHRGQTLATGPPAEIQDNEEVLEVYLEG